MKLKELNTPFEKKRILAYGRDGNTAVRRYIERTAGVTPAVLFLWARLWAQGKEGQLVAVGKRIAGRGAGRPGRRIGRER